MLDHPLSSFEFRILFIAKTKAIWSHAESNILHKLDCLTLTTSDGYPAYLNKRVNEVKWIAKDYPHDEIEDVVNYLIRERNRERNK
jgi:hypothetical protein